MSALTRSFLKQTMHTTYRILSPAPVDRDLALTLALPRLLRPDINNDAADDDLRVSVQLYSLTSCN